MLAAVIFNALIIVALIPLALKGCRLSPGRRGGYAAAQFVDLWRVGGVLVPFVGIKAIDILLAIGGGGMSFLLIRHSRMEGAESSLSACTLW